MNARGRSGRTTGAVGLVALALAAGCRPGAGPSAAEVVARNVAARGGLNAWRKVETMIWTGRIESAHVPGSGMQFTLEQKRPNKTRMLITALGEKSVRVFDGTQGWRLHLVQGRPELQPFTPRELRFAQAGHGIDGPLIDHQAKGNSVTVEGVDEIGPRKAYHLNLHLAKGGSEDVWVDADSFLEIRHDRMAEGPAGARRISTTYADYHTVEGLKIPFVIETGGGSGPTPDKLLLDRVLLNTPLEDSAFANPSNPHPRNRRQPGLAHQALTPVAPSTAPSAPSEEPGSTLQ